MFTGSIYNDKVILAGGHLGEGVDFRDGTTILQKTHYNLNYKEDSKQQKHIEVFGGRGVLVVRNPYKALVSSWNYARTHSHTESADIHNPAFLTFAKKEIFVWLELIEDWVKQATELHCLVYENLKEDPKAELRKLLKHLNLPVDDSRLECIEKHNSQKFHRAHNGSDNIEAFPLEVRVLMDEAILKANELIYERTRVYLPLKKFAGLSL